MKTFVSLLALAVASVASVEPQHPARVFLLQFRQTEFVVPVGETWRLQWCSPYQAGDVCPSYDLRVMHGTVRIGAHGEAQAQPGSHSLDAEGFVEFSAANREVTVWLGPGGRFSTANDLLKIKVSVFRENQGL